MFITKILCVVLVLLVFKDCSNGTVNVKDSKDVPNKTNSQNIQQDTQAQKALVEISPGVIVLSKKYGKDDFVRIYNEDGSLWYEFTYYYDDSDGKFEYYNENFNPFSFHPDYFVLALRCVREDNSRYEVIVDEDTGLKKFVRKDDPTLKLKTWEEHILELFAVDFNNELNPLRETPEGKIKIVDLPKDATFDPVEIKGDWLKVRWDSSKKEKKSGKFGWIKWKENDVIMIEFFYFS